MNAKILELRDIGTFIPILCVDVGRADNEAQRYLMRRVGCALDGNPNIILTKLTADGSGASNDPYHWGGRTFPVAHDWIINHWPEIQDGDVIDVEFILGERSERKVSEREGDDL